MKCQSIMMMVRWSFPRPNNFVFCIATRTTATLFSSTSPPSSRITRSAGGGAFQVKKFSDKIKYYFRAMSSSSGVVSEKPLAHEIDELFTGKEDDFGGVIVRFTNKMESNVFASLLRASMAQWKLQGKKGVWLEIPIECVNLVEAAVKEGFYYHHAEPKYLMLVHWIPETNNTLPANATHRVGIGAFVLNKEDQVLVVQEKSGKFHGTGIWKFPTGVVEQGEDICDAAVREVKEETGIITEFKEILAFRQSHKAFFQKSDLFFVCMLEPLSFDIQKQDLEIEAAEWMPFEEYAAQPFVKKHELLKYLVDICLAKKERKYTGFTPVPTTSTFSPEKSFLYLNRRDLSSP